MLLPAADQFEAFTHDPIQWLVGVHHGVGTSRELVLQLSFDAMPGRAREVLSIAPRLDAYVARGRGGTKKQ
jgi:hypothetical protein